MMKNSFFHLKSSFRSEDIFQFFSGHFGHVGKTD